MTTKMSHELLPAAAIRSSLASLPGWTVEGSELVRTFTFATYLAGIDFVNRVALLAERANHHPDLMVQWRRVTVRITTHSSGGLTALDFTLAGQISLR